MMLYDHLGEFFGIVRCLFVVYVWLVFSGVITRFDRYNFVYIYISNDRYVRDGYVTEVYRTGYAYPEATKQGQIQGHMVTKWTNKT